VFEELIKKLMSILTALEDVGSITTPPEVLIELKDIINSLENSKCSNGMFCGMEQIWIN
tara:strand:+ start:31 stop:207 length:177 start_codon:yes stop_codon:yes gene_type:complete